MAFRILPKWQNFAKSGHTVDRWRSCSAFVAQNVPRKDDTRRKCVNSNVLLIWAVVATQLANQSFPIPQVHSLNPVIGNILYKKYIAVICWRDEHNEKEAGNGPIFSSSFNWTITLRGVETKSRPLFVICYLDNIIKISIEQTLLHIFKLQLK